MNVIIVSKFLKTPKKISLRDPLTAAALGGVMLAIFGLGMIGGYLSHGADRKTLAEIETLRGQMRVQQDDLDKARESQRAIIDGMELAIPTDPKLTHSTRKRSFKGRKEFTNSTDVPELLGIS